MEEAAVDVLGAPLREGDEVVASRWRRRWRRARRRMQAGFLAGVIGVPLALRAVGSEDFAVPIAVFVLLVAGFTLGHLWAGARMWMRPVQVFNEGVNATRIARFVAPRRFARWVEVESASVEPWGSYGERLVFKLRGGGAVHTIPGELDGAAIASVLALAKERRRAKAPGEGNVAHP